MPHSPSGLLWVSSEAGRAGAGPPPFISVVSSTADWDLDQFRLSGNGDSFVERNHLKGSLWTSDH